jgi:D-galactarolactone isomerase
MKSGHDPARRRAAMMLASLGAVAAGCASHEDAQAQQVPWSAGTAVPRVPIPADACDCHHHIYDAKYPAHASATLLPSDATVADYRKLKRRLGHRRNVVVQPSTYGTDNRLLIDSLKAFGPSSRGVVVVDTQISDHELEQMTAAGVRGVRFNLSFLVGITVEMLEPVAHRVAPLGWHIQVNGTADRLLAVREQLLRLPTPLVIDHMGQLPPPDGVKHPGFVLLRELLGTGRCWIKLSGAYLQTKLGPPNYADAGAVARALIDLAPDRMVWGTDWPHPTKKADEKPDDALLADLLSDWAPTEAVRRKILVENAAKLYGY